MRSPRTELPSSHRDDWKTIKTVVPYLWDYRIRISAALAFMGVAKLANIGVPLTLKAIVDGFERPSAATQIVAVPIALLLVYGLLRLSTSLFNELRNAIFAQASQRSIRRIANEIFRHLHRLSLRFHLDRQTGGVSRDIERGSRSTNQLLHYLIFSILPTIFEISVVTVILLVIYDAWFAIITLTTVALYFIYTYLVTAWRTKFRVRMNEMDSRANSTAVDTLINYETVKYFGNEDYESARFDAHLKEWEKASVKSETTLAMLNVGQGVIIATGLTIIMMLASRGVVVGTMTIGDFVLVNAFLIQLYIPLNFLGTIFREVQHCLTDMERMFKLLDVQPDVTEPPDAPALKISGATVRFSAVHFAYRPDREIIKGIDFTIDSGKKVAVVGASGGGKSTLARLLFRFYDVNAGSISIDGQDIRAVTLASLRQAIGVVPQDTVLFNESIEHNIRYGQPDCSTADVERAARLAYLHDFVSTLPDGYETAVGERGLKLSGGEKQRIAIARTILKDPPILILDEATSALDSHSEKAIQDALRAVVANRTSLVIAHRLSTIVDADEILVLDDGRITERGNHASLLSSGGTYAALWELQQRQASATDSDALVAPSPPISDVLAAS